MMTVKLKESDESRNTTTTLADDGELTVSLAASTTYFIDIVLSFYSNATADIKYAFNYTGTVTNALFIEYTRVVAPVSTGSGDGLGPAYNLGGANLTTPTVRTRAGNDTAGTVGGAVLRGVLITNSSGNLKIQWAQNTSDGADTTMFAGSYIAFATQADMDGTLIVKAADTSRASNNTLTADPDLQFPTQANKKYIAEMMAVDYATNGTPDYQCALHDAQVIQCAGRMNNVLANATGTFGASTETAMHGQFWTSGFLTTPTVGGGITSNTTNKSYRHVHWSQVQGGSDGTLAFEWAQINSSVTPTIVVAPSWMLYEEVIQ